MRKRHRPPAKRRVQRSPTAGVGDQAGTRHDRPRRRPERPRQPDHDDGDSEQGVVEPY